MQDRPTRHLALFLRVYGTVSLVLFTALLLGFAMALADPMYHSKLLTDIPFILLLSGALALWRPSRERATSGEAAAVARATG